MAPTHTAVRRRLARARQLFAEQLSKDADVGRLRATADEVTLLQSILDQRRRQRSLTIAWRAIAIVLAAAGLASLLRLPTADISFAGTMASLLATNGPRSAVLLQDAAVTEVLVSTKNGVSAWHTGTPPPAPPAWNQVDQLWLNVLALNKDAQIGLRGQGHCFELTLWKGGGRADIAFHSGHGDPGEEELLLRAGDVVRFCGERDVYLNLDDPTDVTVGDRRGGVSSMKLVPAIGRATLSIAQEAGSHELRSTEIPILGSLTESRLAGTMGEAIEITVVGRAHHISVETGAGSRNLMPSVLAWIRGTPRLRGSLAIVGGVLGAILTMRERWLQLP